MNIEIKIDGKEVILQIPGLPDLRFSAKNAFVIGTVLVQNSVKADPSILSEKVEV